MCSHFWAGVLTHNNLGLLTSHQNVWVFFPFEPCDPQRNPMVMKRTVTLMLWYSHVISSVQLVTARNNSLNHSSGVSKK